MYAISGISYEVSTWMYMMTIYYCMINSSSKLFIIFKQMMIDEQRMLDQMGALIKIIKQREALFFQALNFTCKNIQSSSNQIDQISIFSNFVMNFNQKERSILEKETQLMKAVGPNQQLEKQGYLIPNTSKQMMRLSARIFQTLQSSLQKTRNSVFNENGRVTIDFVRFKKNLHKIIQQNPIQLFQFSKIIIGFCRNKYRRQIIKINNYIKKLKDGQHISLRQMYTKDGSDASHSPDEKKPVKRESLILNKELNEGNGQMAKKKSSLKRPQASKAKRSLNSKSTKKQKQLQTSKYKEKTQKELKLQKSATAAHLLKVYSIMELHKKDFLQDYIYQRNQEQKQRKRLMTQLMERNKANAQQIKSYYSKCQHYDPTAHNIVANPSSDENKSVPRNDSSVNSKISIKTSFLISKRKQSFTFQSPPDRSDMQFVKNEIPFSRTIRNLSNKKRNSQQKHAKQSNKSKKIFIVKSPLNFEDDMIPKAHITNTGWIQTSLTGRERGKKGQNIRLKKRSNPCPIDQKFLPESYRQTQQHPL